MGSKIALITALGVGYVLGTKAGRERYEQIKSGFRHVRDTPIVSKPLDQAGAKLSDAVRAGGERVTDKVAEAVKERLFGTQNSRQRTQADYVTLDVEEVPPSSASASDYSSGHSSASR